MNSKLHIVADAHIWEVESAFSELPGYDVDLTLLENKQINPDTIGDADILLTRSSTRVNGDLLHGSSVRFAGTATIGDDHYDKTWLDAHDVAWANAAGSSTDSVIEYMITALLELHSRGLIRIPDTCIGVIGVGRIGGKLASMCEAMGMRVLRNDPPRARAENTAGFSSLDAVLEQADLLTLHTPLIHDGANCTIRLLGQEQLTAFRGKGIINAGRGACVDNSALTDWLDNDADTDADTDPGRFAVLDCWESEPQPHSRLFSHAGMAIATPHIAGHSIDGKAANTLFIYKALCSFLSIKPIWNMHDHLPAPKSTHAITAQGDSWQQLHAATSWLYALTEDNETMKSWLDLSSSELPNAFSGYRRHYPTRRDWQYAPIHFNHADMNTIRLAQAIGIRTV